MNDIKTISFPLRISRGNYFPLEVEVQWDAAVNEYILTRSAIDKIEEKEQEIELLQK